MQVIKTIKPDSPGAKKYRNKWGDNLVAVRYRRDEQTKKRYTTIELIVDRSDFSQAEAKLELTKLQNSVVAVYLEYEQTNLRRRLKQNGAKWSAELRMWLAPYRTIESLSITDRIIPGAAEKCTDVDIDKL